MSAAPRPGTRTPLPAPVAVIHQPNFAPRLKVLQKIVAGDIWVVLDTVQYVGREWQNRCRLRHLDRAHRAFWLTIPVHRPQGRATVISQVAVVDVARSKRLVERSVQTAYGRSVHAGWLREFVRRLVATPASSLTELATGSVTAALAMLGLTRRPRLASDLSAAVDPTDRLVDLCCAVGARSYLTGSGGLRYLDPTRFARAGIAVGAQRWEPPAPPARHPEAGYEQVSFLDYVARRGPDALVRHLLDVRVEVM